jgi:hypothetical protein
VASEMWYCLAAVGFRLLLENASILQTVLDMILIYVYVTAQFNRSLLGGDAPYCTDSDEANIFYQYSFLW